MTAEVLEPVEQTADREAPAVPASAARDLVHGTSALGTAVLLERGFGFLANLLAARIGGATTFGSYSLAITTANNVSTYAAGGIASTAIRFSGRYSRESAGYSTLAKTLLIIAVSSAAAGAFVLWLGAAPLAQLLGRRSLTPLFQWTAVSVAGMILLECCRGFLVGQRQIRSIVVLSSTAGLGMLVSIPLLARIGAVPMIAAQGTVMVCAVLLCMFVSRPLRREQATEVEQVPLLPMLREVWTFGLVQLAGLIGLNAAGWWLTSLLARADSSMTQMGFFAISSQIRNMASLAPALLTESSLAVMAQGENDVERTPDRVMAACTWATTFVSLALAGLGIALVPWILPVVYGRAYAGAATAVALALATAVVHMGTGPAAARVSILSVRMAGAINTIWAIVVALAALTFIWFGGGASRACLIYLFAHLITGALLWFTLRRFNSMPAGMTSVLVTGAVTTSALVLCTEIRSRYPQWSMTLTAVMLLAVGLGLSGLFSIGRRCRWVPGWEQLKEFMMSRWNARRRMHA
jgi:O-antigen/teichoic acid export membrane protein